MKLLAKFCFPCAAGLLFFALILCTKDVAQAARDGLQLSLQTAVPALFPFFVAGTLLTQSGLARLLGRALSRPIWALYGLQGSAAAALLLGLCGGYPVGAGAACNLYQAGLLSKRDTQILLGFCNHAGPAFILGVAGLAVCGSAKTGGILLIIHILSALLCGVLLTTPPQKGTRPPALPHAPIDTGNAPTLFVNAVRDGFQTCLQVTAFITFFSVLLSIFDAIGLFSLLTSICAPLFACFGIPRDCLPALFRGAFELTNGLSALSALHLPPKLLLPLLSFLLAFGGLSVHCQTLCLLQHAGLSAQRHFWGKLLHATLAALLASAWYFLAPQSVPVLATSGNSAWLHGFGSGSGTLFLIVTILFLKKARKRMKNRV